MDPNAHVNHILTQELLFRLGVVAVVFLGVNQESYNSLIKHVIFEIVL